MKLKVPKYSSGIIKMNLKRFWWMAALMTVYMFLMLPMSVINEIRYAGTLILPNTARETYMHIFESIMNSHAVVYAIAFPIILGCFLLSYLHKVSSVSTFHSLPLNRKSLFVNSFLSGALIIAIPMIVNAIALVIVMPFGGVVAKYTLFDVLKICGHYFLFSYIHLAICFLAGMFTGNFFAHGAFAVILNYLPYIIYYLVSQALKIFLRGFVGQSDRVYNVLEEFPGIKAFDAFNMSTTVFVLYIISFIILFALGLFFYKKRPLESAGDIVSFKFFKPVFKYGFTACTMISGYFLFQSDRKELAGIFYALLFAIIGYAAADMLLTKSLKFWKNYKGFLGYVAAVAIIFGAVIADPFGYSSYIPEKSEIKMAYLNFESNSPTVFREAVGIESTSNGRYRYNGYDGAVFENSEGIDTVLTLHNAVLEIPEGQYNDFVAIGYVLNNGKTVFRYFKADKFKMDSHVNRATQNEEYVNAKSPILRRERDEISAIRIQIYSEDKEHVITDKNQITAFLDCMIADRAALGEAADYGAHIGYIQLSKANDKNSWYEFDLTEKMLNSVEIIEKFKITLDKQ